MEGSIAARPAGPGEGRLAAGPPTTILVGLVLMLATGWVYLLSNPERYNFYDHFVWQADAFLRGEAAIPYPVEATADSPGNAYFNDVYPVSETEALVPFPPLPALVLLPWVALDGLAADQELVAIWLSALGVGAAWWMLGALSVRLAVRGMTTAFLAFGTVFWWTAAVGSTWYFAHTVAVLLTCLAVGVALRADPAAARPEPWATEPEPADATDADRDARAARSTDADLDEDADDGVGLADALGIPRSPQALVRAILPLDGRQFVAGLLLGLAGTARLPVLLGAPFFVLVGSGGTWPRRAVSAGLGAVIPVAALLVYNLVVTGHLFHPAYEYQYRLEALGYPTLGYHVEWAIEDLRYVPQNLGIMLGSLPAVLPDFLPNALQPDAFRLCTEPGAVRGFLDPECPLIVPRDIGTSLLLVSPAYLAAIPVVRGWGRSRLVTGALLAIGAIALLNLMHFSQGWVQWGYRFSNDFAPFALPLVALGAARLRGAWRWLAVALLVASVAINAWGVLWGNLLGW